MRKISYLALILLVCVSCSKLEMLQRDEKSLLRGDDFNSKLALEYLNYSRAKANGYQWLDADFFAGKGLDAKNGLTIYPEAPEQWNIQKDKIEELTFGRDRLVLATNNISKTLIPAQLARLFMLYDCWIEQSQTDTNPGKLAKCQTQFFALLEEVESFLLEQSITLKPVKNTKPKMNKDDEVLKFTFYFDRDSYKFNHNANKVFKSLLKYLESLNGGYKLSIEGNADRLGKRIYNQALARKRSYMVRDMLLKNGVPLRLISKVLYHGEADPKIITKNNQQEWLNRRVNVYVRKAKDIIQEKDPLPLIDDNRNYLRRMDEQNKLNYRTPKKLKLEPIRGNKKEKEILLEVEPYPVKERVKSQEEQQPAKIEPQRKRFKFIGKSQ